MEHLGIPEACQPNALDAIYLGAAPPYDMKGFEHFPERLGFSSDELISITKDDLANPDHPFYNYTPAFVESFIQEWLWIGTMHEFALACSQPFEREDLIREIGSPNKKILSTERLLPYLRRLVISRLLIEGVPLDLQVGEVVSFKIPASYSPTDRDMTFENELIAGIDADLFVTTAQDLKFHLCFVRRYPHISSERCTTSQSFDSVPLRALYDTLKATIRGKDASLWTSYRTPSQSRFARHLRRLAQITQTLISKEPLILSFAIICAIDVLCCSLNATWFELTLENADVVTAPNASYLGLLAARMVDNNWCLARAADLLGGKDINRCYLNSILPSYETQSHKGCEVVRCLKRPAQAEDINLKHRDSCDFRCRIEFVDQLELIRVLNSNGNPGLRRERASQSYNAVYKVVDVRKYPYVAISHVWSHGLGNPAQNALPNCQLQFLFDAVEELQPKEQVLWIDTISVPVDPEWKRIAIMQLRMVYQRASKVLVLDKHLQQVGGHWLERRLQVLGSEWMKRLWTLQEGRLTSSLYFRFRDETVPLTQLTQTDSPYHTDYDKDIFSEFYKTTGSELKLRFQNTPDLSRHFLNLAVDLAYRSVTVATDEPICLATLLGLNLEDFKPYPTMIDIYKSLPEIPEDIIFVQSRRIEYPGFRWAPSTFLEQGLKTFSEPQSSGQLLLPLGFQIRKDGILIQDDVVFTKSISTSEEVFYIEIPSLGCFVFQGTETQPGFPLSTPWKTAALILEKAINRTLSISKAVLVHTLDIKDEVIYCRFGISGHIWRHDDVGRTQGYKTAQGTTTPQKPLVGQLCRVTAFCVD